MAKKNHGRELWDRMVEFARPPDGLHEYECGAWTLEKLFFLAQYLAQMTQAMVGNPKFSSVNYVDLFCGSGICAVADGTRRRYPGSALLAAGCKKPFDNLFLVDSDGRNIDDLECRLRRLGISSRLHTWRADANGVIDSIVAAIPDRSLTLAFVDPFSLDIHFDTIHRLASGRPMDLLILFADDMDILRNVQAYYYPNPNSKLDHFLGRQSDWRAKWDQLAVREAYQVRKFFADVYIEQLRQIGYQHSDAAITIPRHSRPLYRLVYASKHSLGKKFWDIAVREDLAGNRNLWGVD